jgi:hypothetical protein
MKLWTQLMDWNPSDAELNRLGDWIYVLTETGDRLLKTAVVGAALYLAYEIGAGLVFHFSLAAR